MSADVPLEIFASAFHFDPVALRDLVPEEYAEFRALIGDGLALFVSQLSPTRLSALVRRQASLPTEADLPTRLAHLLHLSPALHKLGQVLARRRELDPGLRRQLHRLETMEPRTPLRFVGDVLERELGSAKRRYRIRLGETPLAEGSVAVVCPIEWSDPGGDRSQRGVVKIIKPGVRRRLAEDLAIFARLADLLDERCDALRLPPLPYRDLFRDVRELLTSELRLDREQEHLRVASAQYEHAHDLVIPAPLPFCTPNVTAMQRLEGPKITGRTNGSFLQDRRLFTTVARRLIADVIFTRDESFIFHGDPHAGNLVATQDGRVGVLDWSLAGTIRNAQREQFVQILVAALLKDQSRLFSAVRGLSSAPRARVEEALSAVAPQSRPDLRLTMHLLDALALAGVEFPANLTRFRRSFFTLEGVLHDVCPQASLDEQLLLEAMRHLALEWPTRWLQPMGSRAFRTNVSTLDLLLTSWFGPWRR